MAYEGTLELNAWYWVVCDEDDEMVPAQYFVNRAHKDGAWFMGGRVHTKRSVRVLDRIPHPTAKKVETART